jgi:Tol biopolymer transport system component
MFPIRAMVRWIAYIDPQGRGLLRSRTDGTERLQLVTNDLHPAFPRWSPDGNWIIFGGDLPRQPIRTFIVPAAGGQVESVLDTEMRDPDWSDDGTRSVGSHSPQDKDSNSAELVIVDVASKRAEKIPGSDHLAMSRWSPDGRHISATSLDQTQLKLWDVSTKEWRVIAHGEALGISVWSPDGHFLYFQDLLGPGEQLYRYDVTSRRTETVFEFADFLKSGVSRCALFAVTPDGSPIVGFSRSAYDLFIGRGCLALLGVPLKNWRTTEGKSVGCTSFAGITRFWMCDA